MKKFLQLGAVLFIVMITMAFADSMKVSFSKTDWDTTKQKAISEKKLFYVEFDANYCAACRNMEQSTYMDSRLASYIDQNVVAQKVNVQDFDGVMWSQQYDVQALPTMLIFDSKGKLVKRMVGYQSADDLLREFKAVRAKEQATVSTVVNNPNEIPQQQSETPLYNATLTTDTEKEPPTPKPNTTEPTNTNTSPSIENTVTNPTINTPTIPEPQGNGLFEISIKEQPSKGYGVQIGVFTSYENLIEEAQKAKKSYPDKPTIMHLDKLRGENSYKLLIGGFVSKRDAYTFSNQLRVAGTASIVKDLSLLK